MSKTWKGWAVFGPYGEIIALSHAEPLAKARHQAIHTALMRLWLDDLKDIINQGYTVDPVAIIREVEGE